MTAPTETEIRDLIAARQARYPTDCMEHSLEEAIGKAFDVIGYIALDEQGRYDYDADFLSDTWADLRPSEAEHLTKIIAACKADALEAARAAIVAEVVTAALAFTDEYPDAPRAVKEPVSA